VTIQFLEENKMAALTSCSPHLITWPQSLASGWLVQAKHSGPRHVTVDKRKELVGKQIIKCVCLYI